jgi:hypothetical protein
MPVAVVMSSFSSTLVWSIITDFHLQVIESLGAIAAFGRDAYLTSLVYTTRDMFIVALSLYTS